MELAHSSCFMTSRRRRVASVSTLSVDVLDHDCLVGYRCLKVKSSKAFCSSTTTLSIDQGIDHNKNCQMTHNLSTQSDYPLVHDNSVLLLNNSVSPSHSSSMNGLTVRIRSPWLLAMVTINQNSTVSGSVIKPHMFEDAPVTLFPL